MGSLHQHLPQVRITFLGDTELWLTLARFTSSWPQAHIAANIPALLKSCLIIQRQYERESDQWSDSLHLLQEYGFRVIFPGDPLHFSIHFLDPCCQGNNLFHQ